MTYASTGAPPAAIPAILFNGMLLSGIRVIDQTEALIVPVTPLVGVPSPFTPVDKFLETSAAVVAADGEWLIAQIADVVVNLARGADDLLMVELSMAFDGVALLSTGIHKSLPDVVAARHGATAEADLLLVFLVAIERGAFSVTLFYLFDCIWVRRTQNNSSKEEDGKTVDAEELHFGVFRIGSKFWSVRGHPGAVL